MPTSSISVEQLVPGYASFLTEMLGQPLKWPKPEPLWMFFLALEARQKVELLLHLSWDASS